MKNLFEIHLYQELHGHSGVVWNIAWSPRGRELASCGADKSIIIWQLDGEQWVKAHVLASGHSGTVRRVAWSPDARYIASASFDGSVVIWDREVDWEQVTTLEGHENEVKAVAWCPTRPYIATCGRDKTVWIWEQVASDQFECVDVKQAHTQDVKALVWEGSGLQVLSGSYDASVRVWEEDVEGNGEEWHQSQELTGCNSTIWDLAMLNSKQQNDGPYRQSLAACSGESTVHIWQRAAQSGDGSRWRLMCSQSVTQQLPDNSHSKGASEEPVYSVDWGPFGLCICGVGDNSIRLLEMSADDSRTNTGEQVSLKQVGEVSEAHTADVNCVRCQPIEGSQLIASCGDDSVICIWKVEKTDYEML